MITCNLLTLLQQPEIFANTWNPSINSDNIALANYLHIVLYRHTPLASITDPRDAIHCALISINDIHRHLFNIPEIRQGLLDTLKSYVPDNQITLNLITTALDSQINKTTRPWYFLWLVEVYALPADLRSSLEEAKGAINANFEQKIREQARATAANTAASPPTPVTALAARPVDTNSTGVIVDTPRARDAESQQRTTVTAVPTRPSPVLALRTALQQQRQDQSPAMSQVEEARRSREAAEAKQKADADAYAYRCARVLSAGIEQPGPHFHPGALPPHMRGLLMQRR